MIFRISTRRRLPVQFVQFLWRLQHVQEVIVADPLHAVTITFPVCNSFVIICCIADTAERKITFNTTLKPMWLQLSCFVEVRYHEGLQSLLEFTIYTYSYQVLHQFLISSFRVFARTHTKLSKVRAWTGQRDTQTYAHEQTDATESITSRIRGWWQILVSRSSRYLRL